MSTTNLPLHKIKAYTRMDADIVGDSRWTKVAKDQRANGLWVLLGLTGVSRINGWFGCVPDYQAHLEGIVGRLPMDEDGVIDHLATAGFVSVDGDTLTIIDWAEWQQTGEVVAETRINRAHAANVKHAKDRALVIEDGLDKGLTLAAIRATLPPSVDDEKWALATTFVGSTYAARMQAACTVHAGAVHNDAGVMQNPAEEEENKKENKNKKVKTTTSSRDSVFANEKTSSPSDQISTDEDKTSTDAIIVALPVENSMTKATNLVMARNNGVTAEARRKEGIAPMTQVLADGLIVAVAASLEKGDNDDAVSDAIVDALMKGAKPASYYPKTVRGYMDRKNTPEAVSGAHSGSHRARTPTGAFDVLPVTA